MSKDFTHRVTFYNWIHFEIIFHPTPDGNLQEEKPLNSGVKTKGAFGHSRPCVCILRVAAISLHFFFLLYSIVIQTEGHAKEALLLTPQPYKILLIFCSPRAPRFVPLWSPFHVYYSQSFLMKRTYRLLTLFMRSNITIWSTWPSTLKLEWNFQDFISKTGNLSATVKSYYIIYMLVYFLRDCTAKTLLPNSAQAITGIPSLWQLTNLLF